MNNEKDLRLGLLRQYFLDVVDSDGSQNEFVESATYIRFNFDKAVKAAHAEWTESEKITRKMCFLKSLGDSDLKPFEICAPMVEIMSSKIHSILKTPESFALWFHKNLIGPIHAEEKRILGHSTSSVINVFGPIKAYFDQVAEMFRFKVWEIVLFPDAKDVPPRVAPTPDEAGQPSRKTE